MALSGIQKIALRALADKPRGEASSYDLKVSTGFSISTGTMQALTNRGLAFKVAAPGNMAFPQNAVYRVTEAGREALMLAGTKAASDDDEPSESDQGLIPIPDGYAEQ